MTFEDILIWASNKKSKRAGRWIYCAIQEHEKKRRWRQPIPLPITLASLQKKKNDCTACKLPSNAVDMILVCADIVGLIPYSHISSISAISSVLVLVCDCPSSVWSAAAIVCSTSGVFLLKDSSNVLPKLLWYKSVFELF